MKKKIAILHAQVPFVFGGAEILVQSLKSNLMVRGFDADVITLPYKWYPEKSLYNTMKAWRSLDFSASNGQKIDMVIGTKFPSYGASHDNKIVWLVHQYRQVYDLYNSRYGLKDKPHGKKIKRKVEKYDKQTLTEAKAIYGISKNVTDRLEMFNKINAMPLYPPPALVGQYKTEDSDNYIFSAGRLDKIKRVDLLINALAFCDKKIRLKIAGRGPEEQKLKELVNLLKLTDRVDFLGFVSDQDLIDLYAQSFGVFFAPLDEDYGYITLEAFFSKKPVITCLDAGGVLEFVENGEDGFVCEVKPEIIGEKINYLFFNKQQALGMGERGFQRVKDINWDNVIKALTNYL